MELSCVCGWDKKSVKEFCRRGIIVYTEYQSVCPFVGLRFLFFKLTQPLTVSTIQLKKKGGKPDRKPYPLSLWFKNPYRNLTSETLKIMPQKPQRDCMFMNSASGLEPMYHTLVALLTHKLNVRQHLLDTIFIHRLSIYYSTMVRKHRITTAHRTSANTISKAQFIVPDWGDKVDNGIGLSYRPVRLHKT
jgi:hypothetical protein